MLLLLFFFMLQQINLIHFSCLLSELQKFHKNITHSSECSQKQKKNEMKNYTAERSILAAEAFQKCSNNISIYAKQCLYFHILISYL